MKYAISVKKNIYVLNFVLFFYSNFCAQQFPNTVTMDNSTVSPPASIKDIKWLEGNWKGEAFGGIAEEIWSSPVNSSMMGMFRLVKADTVEFYELCTIIEKNNSLVLRIKHFHSDLKGWEDKNVTVDFPLVKISDKRVYFDGFTIERTNENELNMFVIVEHNQNKREVRFNYRRIK